MQAGMDYFMGKPFNYVDLETILEGHDRDLLVANVVWQYNNLLEGWGVKREYGDRCKWEMKGVVKRSVWQEGKNE